jgi:hypothetical protein
MVPKCVYVERTSYGRTSQAVVEKVLACLFPFDSMLVRTSIDWKGFFLSSARHGNGFALIDRKHHLHEMVQDR